VEKDYVGEDAIETKVISLLLIYTKVSLINEYFFNYCPLDKEKISKMFSNNFKIF
jgi:hypothetical protein